MSDIISSFKNYYSFLSNFYTPAPVVYEGLLYQCSEGAYQAAKSMDLNDRLKFVALNGPQSKKLGKTLKLREDWNSVRIKIMCEIVLDKFERNTGLRELLIKTGDAVLIEGNYWNDRFWGVCNGTGANHLGIILMDVRELLK